MHDWTDITATTTYANKNLYLRNLTLDDGHHFQTVNIDLSKAGGGKLTVEVTGSVGEGRTIGGQRRAERDQVVLRYDDEGKRCQYFLRPA